MSASVRDDETKNIARTKLIKDGPLIMRMLLNLNVSVEKSSGVDKACVSSSTKL